MVDSEFVAVGAETQAGLSDLGVMPKTGGEGDTKQALEPWAMQSVAFARALPPKEKK
jgi:hypothetical protein